MKILPVMEQDSSQLKEEIARLHAIIDILIRQNKTLHAEIAYLKNRNASPDVFSSNDKIEKGSSGSDNSYDKIEKGITNAYTSNENFEKGSSGADNSYVKVEKGSSGVDNSSDKIEKGITGVDSSFVKSDIGIKYTGSPLVKSDTGRTDVLNPLPIFVEVTPAVVARLALLLKASGVKKVRRSTLTDMATIILRGHNKQDCSHRELRKITGHSEGGIAKLLIAMKKRGLIFRDGFKRFGLSAASKEMLRQAIAN